MMTTASRVGFIGSDKNVPRETLRKGLFYLLHCRWKRGEKIENAYNTCVLG